MRIVNHFQIIYNSAELYNIKKKINKPFFGLVLLSLEKPFIYN